MAKENETCTCGHVIHAVTPSGSLGRCLGCLKCYGFTLPVIPIEPEPVYLTLDQYEGMKNSLSFANSQIEELVEKNIKQEQLRRDAIALSSATTRNNFDLMQQKARLEAKLRCAEGVHGVTVGTDKDEVCKDCGRKINDETWRDRPPVMVSLEVAPNTYVGPYVLVTPDERNSWSINWDKAAEMVDAYLDRIIELEAKYDENTDPQPFDLVEEIEKDQDIQSQLEWERLSTYGEE